MTPDHSALIERLEAHDGSHDRGCDGRNYACTCGDDDKGEVLLKEAAAALRDQQSQMQMMQARLDRWEPKPCCGPSFSSSLLTGQAEQPSDASRVFISRLFDGGASLPSAPNQAKEAGE